MEISLAEPQRKIKNPLIRHSCLEEIKLHTSSYHPEKSHLFKYAPKYYKNLTLEVTSHNPLLSKIKKIKKLQTFKGVFQKKFYSELLRTILANNKKNIEKIPEIICDPSKIGLNKPFWTRLTQWKIKFFPNITRLAIPKRKTEDLDNFLLSRKFLMNKYLGNMRKLKTLELYLRAANNEGVKWMLSKLDGIGESLDRFETFIMQVDDLGVNLQELFKNKNLISHLTNLRFSFNLTRFGPCLMMIPEKCKKLRSLSMGFRPSFDEDPEFRGFLTGLTNLSRLISLQFFWPDKARNFWTCFKPQSSLRFLRLRFDVSDLIKTNSERLENLLGRWEDINELEEMELDLSCRGVEDLLFIQMLITMMLQKVKKLCSFKCLIFAHFYFEGDSMSFEPFSIEQVPHLYDSLQKFEFVLTNTNPCNDIEFDLKKMKVFRNLKEVSLGGRRIAYENLEEMISLLEESQENGEFSVLELKLESARESDWLKKSLEQISKAKKKEDSCLKILIDLCFRTESIGFVGDLELLEELCRDIVSVELIKGLFVRLMLMNLEDACPFAAEDLKQVIEKFGEIRNLEVELCYWRKTFEYVRMERQKKDLLLIDRKNAI